MPTSGAKVTRKAAAERTTTGGRARTLADVYRRFGAGEGAKISPVYGQIATALSESAGALNVIEAMPARKRQPTMILAALHDLALSGQAPELAAAFGTSARSAVGITPLEPGAITPAEASAVPTVQSRAGLPVEAGAARPVEAGATVPAAAGAAAHVEAGTAVPVDGVAAVPVDGVAAVPVDGVAARHVETAARAIEALVGLREVVTGRIATRRVRGDEDGRHAVLYPAIADAARRAGAGQIGLIDVGRSAGLNLTVDRVGIAYGNGQVLGDPGSGVRVTASVVGDRSLNAVPMPEVAVRVAVGPDLVDVTDPDEARWLRACVPPDRVERLERLGAEVQLAAAEPPALVHGDVLDTLPEAIAAVPGDVLPVVMTTWVLSRLSLEERLRFLQRLDQAATRRPVAWVSVEGVGVAPGVPTFGDRPASGHSILGISLFEHSSFHSTAVGRAWLRGEMLTWLTPH
jgi:hypothetical protein